MQEFKRGDVLWIPVVFADKVGSKFRPAIVLKYNENDLRILILEIHTLKDKHKASDGILVEKDSAIAKEMGLDEDSIILGASKCWIRAHFAKYSKKGNPIGFCPIMDEIEKKFSI